ncbi:hypothetical protein RhiirA5_419788 [Rhizophagus irregularis]|uniref:Uncharacterized protein n=1 Tax=Rhizophagus irregularis TaxID=588596 RepID=A0A2N0PHG9_9GLOM|nr:hypothetical protein RhiirA5_419788 [Rhizophagus irregularis]
MSGAHLQDDGVAYRTFCSSNFKQRLGNNYKVEQVAIYLFVMKFNIETFSTNISRFCINANKFFSYQSFGIFTSEPCEHFFGITRQINADFDFAEFIQMIPKIAQYNNALRNQKLNFDKEKNNIFSGQLNDLSFEILRLWPTDKQIMQTIHHSHRLALELTPANPENLSIDINNSLIIIGSQILLKKEIGRNSNDLDDDDDSSSVNIFSGWPNATNEFSDFLSVFK